VTSLKERIVDMHLYRAGDSFDASTVAQRFKVSTNEVRDACRVLCNQRKLVSFIKDNRSTVYTRPLYNRWLGKPWVMYRPPCPMPEELTPSTAFIYGSPMYDI